MKSFRIALVVVAGCGWATLSPAEDMETLHIDIPPAKLDGTPVPITGVKNLEAPARRPPLLVPKGVTNLALGKPVTSSDPAPSLGDLTLVTDGEKESDEGYYVELAPGVQWVQIDLQAEARIYAIALWHYHAQARVYKGVVVQVSDDPDFITGATTVFNDDADNSDGLGLGRDKAYIDAHEGKVIPVGGVKGRYVRLYSDGNTSNPYNDYIEVEVYGKPAP